MQPLISIKNLSVFAGEKKLISSISLDVAPGELHVIMGPNGAGKSSLINAVMGNPALRVDSGHILLDGRELVDASPEERAVQGLFMAFQYPRELPGIQLDRFLYTAYRRLEEQRGKKPLSVFAFGDRMKEEMARLRIDPSFAGRDVNAGFSGGEKKKIEMLQLALLSPRVALLDETDSGLDVDALKTVGEAIARFVTPDTAAIVVTHYHKFLHYVQPTRVHVISGGLVVASGGPELAQDIERDGFEKLITA